MDKYSKSVYDFILSQPEHSFFYQAAPGAVPGGIDKFSDFKAACRYLKGEGYAEMHSPGEVILTHRGIHKRELDRINYIKMFLTHFIPGVLTGVVTTLAAELLLRYLF